MIRWFSNPSRKLSAAHLLLEALECRLVPANQTLRWHFNNPNNNNWSDAANWQVQGANSSWGPATAAPDSTDKAIFYDGQTRDVSVNVTNVGTIEIQAGYTGALLLPGVPVYVSLLTMKGGTIRSGGDHWGSLSVFNASNTITAGVIDGVGLHVGNASTRASLTIDGDISLSENAQIYVNKSIDGDSELSWASGNIITPANADGSNSSSGIWNYGTFRIYSNGQLGVPASATEERLVNSNEGTLIVYGSPVVAGSFDNQGGVSVRSSANLKIQGTAKQYKGTTELRGGTITMTANTGVYAVNAGSLIGNGTIDGNLTLGMVNNEAVSISPGYTGAEAGTLTITKSMHIISTGATTNIQIFNNAGTVTLDKIVVQGGYAILNGTLTVHIAVDYKPDLGTKHTFITAPTFKAPGTTTPTAFATRNLTGQTAYWFPQPGVFRVWRWSPAVDGSYSVHVGDSMS